MPESTNEQELKKLDDADVSKLHWKIVLISGMGFFTDAYDLFIIGVVMAMLKPEWHLTAIQTGLVTSTALLASAVGAVLFGRIADLLGRKRIYGVEVLVLAAGAIACGFAPNIIWLIVFRIVLGLGIGGDYPVSATLMSEYAGEKVTRHADKPCVRHAGCGPDFWTAVRGRTSGIQFVSRFDLAHLISIRCRAGARGIFRAPKDRRDPAFQNGPGQTSEKPGRRG